MVFHRAFDCVKDPYESMEALIAMGVDRVLTSGLKAKAVDGMELIAKLQERYGEEIEILAGSGINAFNALEIMEKTGISQVHSSCKDWIVDPTTKANGVSSSLASGEQEMMHDVVSAELVAQLLAAL